ncbi:hypothetical protein PIB30_050696 [Stylosanthes scabra]|uniref:Uncharacterized protein n=1 Tax=Stylosanthes scabra TaxID=79078 RepID=A0ABU6THI3_9FABA|nr:hypothetical protein [Stylosanthes scabra]
MAARTRQTALDEIQGTYAEQYKRLADYAAELLRSNPSSSVHLKVSRSPDFEQESQSSNQVHWCIFQRIYIFLDACGDPNDHMLPIAYALVESENKDSPRLDELSPRRNKSPQGREVNPYPHILGMHNCEDIDPTMDSSKSATTTHASRHQIASVSRGPHPYWQGRTNSGGRLNFVPPHPTYGGPTANVICTFQPTVETLWETTRY